MSEINALIEKLKAKTGPDRELDALLALHVAGWSGGPGKAYWTDDHGRHRNRPPEWTASIDAALALVEKMLPGWVWGITAPVGRMADGMLWKPDADDERGFSQKVKVEAPTPPLAILIALLSALSGDKQ